MKNIYKKINNQFPSINEIQKNILEFRNVKHVKNSVSVNNKYMDRNVRRKRSLEVLFLIHTNEVSKFSLFGYVKKKKKKYNLNSSITIRTILSGKYVNFNFHPFSPGIRLL